jgi:hypothetical protein
MKNLGLLTVDKKMDLLVLVAANRRPGLLSTKAKAGP